MRNEITYSAVGIALLGIGAWLLLKRKQTKTIITNTTMQEETVITSDIDRLENGRKDKPKGYPLGYWNNNPLNIRVIPNSPIDWEGEYQPNTDGEFEQFKTMAYGYRAAFVNMRTHINKKGEKTVAQLITAWAPKNENNTNGYIATVCKLTGFVAGTILNPYDEEQMKKLAAAMSIVENTSLYPVPYDAIDEGWNMYIS